VSLLRIKKNDIVIAATGVNAGKSGKVLQVLPLRGRAIVERLNLVKKCMRKTKDSAQGGIVEKEGTISLSNLMLYCPDCKKGVRIRRVSENSKSVRKCKSCGHSFES
jgi:large subunit ribosomal protein L24